MKHEKSDHTKVDALIEQAKAGSLLFPADYLAVGSAASIHKIFSRLAKDKKVIRLAKGIYLKPKHDPELGILYPSTDEIATKITKNEKVVIRPTGSYALNKLGLSTQVPTKVVFLTDGSPRKIKIGKGSITFKSTTPKKLAAKNELVFLASQALMALDKDGLTEKVFDHLVKVLSHQPPEDIREGARLSPGKVAATLYKVADKIAHHA
ncbi:MAG TPA: DUF6088 family protein [Chitinophagaceae bacterium]|nr:DUF6088 family protein [Chitinophagaceae bacterium]